jgi:hypothetical protein
MPCRCRRRDSVTGAFGDRGESKRIAAVVGGLGKVKLIEDFRRELVLRVLNLGTRENPALNGVPCGQLVVAEVGLAGLRLAGQPIRPVLPAADVADDADGPPVAVSVDRTAYHAASLQRLASSTTTP